MVNIDRKKAEEIYYNLMIEFNKFKNEPTYDYKKNQHHLYEESEYPGISKNYYNEWGSVEFENYDGDIIVFKISRFHNHQHNGCSGLCAAPCRDIVISKKVGEDLEVLWKMHIVCGTLHYSGEVTSMDIPYNLLNKAQSKEEGRNDELLKDSMPDSDITEVDKVDWDRELTEVSKQYDSFLSMRDNVIAERDKKVTEAVNNINREYASLINKCDSDIKKCSEKIESIKSILSSYSTFDIKMLGCCLSQLISTIECSEYFYREVTCKCTRRVNGPIDSWDEDYEKKVHIICRDKNLSSISESDLSSNDIIVIDEGNPSKTSKNNFPYIQEFINYMVKYRKENNLESFSSEDMVLLLQKFLEAYQDKILENYRAKIKVKIGNINF